jgi:hypothetical protein
LITRAFSGPTSTHTQSVSGFGWSVIKIKPPLINVIMMKNGGSLKAKLKAM